MREIADYFDFLAVARPGVVQVLLREAALPGQGEKRVGPGRRGRDRDSVSGRHTHRDVEGDNLALLRPEVLGLLPDLPPRSRT